MTQLAANVNASAELWTVDSLPTTRYVQVGDEIVEVRSSFPSQTFSLTGEETDPKIRVRRAQLGTSAASHNSATTLEPVYGAGGAGGGGVTVDNQSDPPAEVATLIAPGAVLTEGQADLTGVLRFRLLGPYDLDHADEGLSDAWPAHHRFGVELAADTWVLDWLVVPTETWDSIDAELPLTLGVVPTPDLDFDNPQRGYELLVRTGGAAIGHYSLPWTVIAIPPNHQIGGLEGPSNRVPLFVPIAGRLFATIDWSGNGQAVPTSGKVRVYVLIAEPA